MSTHDVAVQFENELLDRFTDRAEGAGATVQTGTPSTLVDHLVSRARSGGLVISPRFSVLQPSLAARLQYAQVCQLASSEHRGHDIAVGVGAAEFGVAETGSVLLDEARLEDRLVDLQSLRLIIVLPAANIVRRLDDVADWFEERAGVGQYASLTTGPSRTADIERSLTVGVQGPAILEILVQL